MILNYKLRILYENYSHHKSIKIFIKINYVLAQEYHRVID